MTDEQKAALEWLNGYIASFGGEGPELPRTIKAMLAEPRLPAEPTQAMLEAMFLAIMENDGDLEDSIPFGYRALYAHLTKPKPKTVEVWRVESAYHGHTRIWQANDGSKSNADQMAVYLATDGHTCIRVTGPHTQEVPQ